MARSESSEYFLGLSSVNIGDAKGHLDVELYDGSGKPTSLRMLTLRERVWRKESWAGEGLCSRKGSMPEFW